ncbi:MAG: tRNA pseudouridine(55) synthase TruB [Nannocystis sp.]|nr:tRNA pseudouridine(55) synthase TruB [Nannocystis sp.]MBA3548276.1 tRNA pseudouridine(55) synthase TruB [Nannocystis sp.]
MSDGPELLESTGSSGHVLRDSEPFGVLLLDKPEGPTSHDVVAWVRWCLGVTQVGHCGTLDPAASGLLVVCVGAATRLVPYLTGVDKVYRARFALGRSTTTEDREGDTVALAPAGPRERDAALAALGGLHGPLMLPPPAFSAVKIDGQRAHRMARRGELVELPPRPMTVRSVEALAGSPDECTEPWVDATIAVSKGTYIRALAVELGRRIELPVHLAALHRLASGALRVDDPRALTGITVQPLPDPRPGLPPKLRLGLARAGQDPGPLTRPELRAALKAALLDPCEALPLPTVAIPADDPRMSTLTRLRHGQAVPLDAELAAWLPESAPTTGEGLPEASRVALRTDGYLIVVRRETCGERGEMLRPERVLAGEKVAPTA